MSVKYFSLLSQFNVCDFLFEAHHIQPLFFLLFSEESTTKHKNQNDNTHILQEHKNGNTLVIKSNCTHRFPPNKCPCLITTQKKLGTGFFFNF